MIEEGGEWFGPGRLLSYLIIGLAFIVLSALLYGRAKLERVGDSMMFRAAEEIITWLVVFVGMSFFGFFFYSIMDTKSSALIGMAVGTLLAFVIVKIVIARTFRFGLRQNLRSLGAFALIAVIFSGCTMYDLTGFTDRVPEADDVVSVERVNLGYGDTFNYWYSYIEEEVLADQETLTSPEAIEKVIALHQYIVDQKLYDYDVVSEGAAVYDSYGNEVYSGNTWMTLRYTMENGSKMSRRFGFQLNQEAADLINAVMTDAEYKDDGALPDIFTPENISSIELSVYDYSYEYEEKYQSGEMTDLELDKAYRTAQAKVVLTDSEEIEDFLSVMNQDHYSRTYTIKSAGTVSLEETAVVTADSKAELAPEFRAMDYMDINGYIYLHPGTEGVQTEWNGTAPEKNSKPIGTANFSVHSGHRETLAFVESRLRADGYTSHANHIAESLR
jgi:hypothetical protein